MSTRELERVEILGRVRSRELKLKDAAAMLQLSYRQAKRVWQRYRKVGSGGLQHGNAGRASHRSKPVKFLQTDQNPSVYSKSAGTWHLGGSTPPPGTNLKAGPGAAFSHIPSCEILSAEGRQIGLVTPLRQEESAKQRERVRGH